MKTEEVSEEAGAREVARDGVHLLERGHQLRDHLVDERPRRDGRRAGRRLLQLEESRDRLEELALALRLVHRVRYAAQLRSVLYMYSCASGEQESAQ